jgi:hypothetical protein
MNLLNYLILKAKFTKYAAFIIPLLWLILGLVVLLLKPTDLSKIAGYLFIILGVIGLIMAYKRRSIKR